MIITSEQESINFLKAHSTEEQIQKLSLYRSLLLESNKHTNLISGSTENEIFYRHILDSFQLLQYIKPKQAVLDIGTGAGFPGLVLAIMGIDIMMVDSNNKKVQFIQKVIDELGLGATIYQDRIENINITTDILTARALKPLSHLLQIIYKTIIVKDKMLFLKGKNLNNELFKAQQKWSFKFNLLPSLTSKESNIIEVYHLKKLPYNYPC